MSSPSDTPRIREFGHLLNPGVEIRVAINPVIKQARESLINIPITKRLCYFEGEKFLKYYRHYSKSNCHLECESNRSLALCQCAPHFMPKSANERFCDQEDLTCRQKVMRDTSTHDVCHCLRSCHEMYYLSTKSYGKLLPNGIWKKINLPEGSSVKSTTIVHFFFTKSNYNKLIKSELFALTDIVSNIGGLLGLFMGFSIMSIVEIIYFLSLRLWCGNHKERRIDNRKKALNTQDYCHIPPKKICP
nr:unnamed protein product [Callosobruchus analis]